MNILKATLFKFYVAQRNHHRTGVGDFSVCSSLLSSAQAFYLKSLLSLWFRVVQSRLISSKQICENESTDSLSECVAMMKSRDVSNENFILSRNFPNE